MVSLPTGSDELIYIQTDKVSVTIKGPASHPNFQGVEQQSNDSCLQISCDDEFQLSLKGNEALGPTTETQNAFTGNYVTMPLFYEQQRYELIIEQMKNAEGVTEELKVRDQMAWVGRMNNIAARAREIVMEEMIYI